MPHFLTIFFLSNILPLPKIHVFSYKYVSHMTHQFVLTHTIRQTEIPALLDSSVTNTLPVNSLYKIKLALLIFSQ